MSGSVLIHVYSLSELRADSRAAGSGYMSRKLTLGLSLPGTLDWSHWWVRIHFRSADSTGRTSSICTGTPLAARAAQPAPSSSQSRLERKPAGGLQIKARVHLKAILFKVMGFTTYFLGGKQRKKLPDSERKNYCHLRGHMAGARAAFWLGGRSCGMAHLRYFL